MHMLKIRSFTFNPYQENTMIVTLDGGHEALIIDPGFTPGEEQRRFFDYLREQSLTPLAVLLTHAHRDHRVGARAVQDRFAVPVYLSRTDRDFFDDIDFDSIEPSEELRIGPFSFKLIPTPGHTPGSVCYYDEDDRVLFSGDTLFRGTIGRTDLDGGDYDKLIVSIMDSLMGLPGDVEVFPGHGERTTIARERTSNPFLQPFNEPEENYDEDELEAIEILP